MSTVEPSSSPRRLPWRLVMLVTAAAALFYGGLVLWAGAADVGYAFVRIGPAATAGALILAMANFAFRFARWQMYLRHLGHRVPPLASLRIYLAGFAFTVSPGKIGENVRALLLRRHGVPFEHSVSAFVSERLIDLTALVLLALPGLAAAPDLRWIAGLVAAGLLAVLGMLVAAPPLARRFEGPGLAGRAVAALLKVLEAARRCQTPRLAVAALLLGLLAWAAEALVLNLVAGQLGVALPLGWTLFAFSIAILAGAVSFVPAGIGGTEALLAVLVAGRGLAAADALALALVVRLTTLWFAVAVGVLALQYETWSRTGADPDRK